MLILVQTLERLKDEVEDKSLHYPADYPEYYKMEFHAYAEVRSRPRLVIQQCIQPFQHCSRRFSPLMKISIASFNCPNCIAKCLQGNMEWMAAYEVEPATQCMYLNCWKQEKTLTWLEAEERMRGAIVDAIQAGCLNTYASRFVPAAKDEWRLIREAGDWRPTDCKATFGLLWRV